MMKNLTEDYEDPADWECCRVYIDSLPMRKGGYEIIYVEGRRFKVPLDFLAVDLDRMEVELPILVNIPYFVADYEGIPHRKLGVRWEQDKVRIRGRVRGK